MTNNHITVEHFFDLFLKELEQQQTLWSYYKFHTDPGSFEFRKAYFCQRLDYIARKIKKQESFTWDVGCGYGTTAIFLALNGYRVHGTTLEFYFKELPHRITYWSNYGDVSKFTYDYEDLFDGQVNREACDYIIVQDTLHHLEPLQEALSILHKHLKPGGEIVVVEENGNNIIQRLKLYRQRGNKRIIEMYDERLQKTILLGNENIRPLSLWRSEMRRQNLCIVPESIEYVRALPPALFNRLGTANALEREGKMWRGNRILREYFFFGINFVATSCKS